MDKQETKKIFTKKLYIDNDLIGDFQAIGTQSAILSSMLDFMDVSEAVKQINIVSMHEEMYPKMPLAALVNCGDFSELKCVIIGGMPEIKKLKDWTGSAYSYDLINYQTVLHKKIVCDILGESAFHGSAKSNNQDLQDTGILMMHDVLSTTEKNFFLCRDFWQPIIFRILHNISKLDSSIPIVFTSSSSMISFKSAVLGSDNIFCLGLSGNDILPSTPKVFGLVQEIINRGEVPASRINFLGLTSKWQ